MRSTVVIIVGFVLLLLLYQFGAKQKAPVIEADIQHRTANAVARNGFADVTVSTDGRDVTLAGTVPAEPDVATVKSIAADVRGVRVVDNRVEVARPYAIEVCKQGARVVAVGSAPDQLSIDRLDARIEELFHREQGEGELRVRGDAPAGFTDLVDRLLADLAKLDRGCLKISDRQATLAGAVHSQATAQRIRRDIDSFDATGFTVSLDLEVPTLSEEAAACQAEYNRRLEPGERVLFDFDRAELHDEGRRLLDEIMNIGESCPDIKVWVTGHTDSVGDREYNIRLSQQRADVVVEYLVGKGMDRARLTAIGFGYSQPVADNATEEGRAKNRRIEFRVRED